MSSKSSTKKQLKGNIYLAKVTRVEPSLQAAFVDYGGQRHGFLAFSEIHPDYYQIPQADRRVLDEAERQLAEAPDGNGAADEADDGASEAVATDPDEEAAEVFDEQARRRSRLLRAYKIQEVIKRRQILLVQVVKEERGTKGAALTSYLSLAGRYSVLMPNTARGGGISRKIANPADRSRLKAIARELEVPEGMGLIIRTAGQERNKLEIRRDYEYSLRLWNDIRERTLQSIAPCTIHEEGALVKRAIRDLYSRDVDEVWIEGEEGYRAARKVMNMLTPSHGRRVKQYREDVPLFHRYGVEERLDALHNPVINLPSGGSVVIHVTEALTAIDVNSGRSTRERNIEETALKTNLEAVDEISRQLRLRDIAGLVVIDFIDMAETRNQRVVERKLREQLKVDRARVQLGRISAFGLLELSRQRLRPSFQELSAQPCPTCHGSGAVRSVESAALQVLRAIELAGMKADAAALAVLLPVPVALYVLNQKRDRLIGLEQRYRLKVEVRVDGTLVAGEYQLETTEPRAADEAPAQTDAERVSRRLPRRRRKRPKQVGGDAGDAAADGGGWSPRTWRPMAASRLRRPISGTRWRPSQPRCGLTRRSCRRQRSTERLRRPEPRMPMARVPRHPLPRSNHRAGGRGRAGGGPRRSAARAQRLRLTTGRPGPSPQQIGMAAHRRMNPSNPRRGSWRQAKPPTPLSGTACRPSGCPTTGWARSPSQSRSRRSGRRGGPGAGARHPARLRAANRPKWLSTTEPVEVERDEAPAAKRARAGRSAGVERAERDEAAAPVEPAMAATAMADRRDAGPPRRGWWSRFVRKDE